MLFGSLNKHSSFSPEELLIVLFPSLFSLAGKNLCLLQGFGGYCEGPEAAGSPVPGKMQLSQGKPDVFGQGLALRLR